MSATVIISLLITTLLLSFWLEYRYFQHAKAKVKMYFKLVWAIVYLCLAVVLYLFYPNGYAHYAFLVFSGLRFYSSWKFYTEHNKSLNPKNDE